MRETDIIDVKKVAEGNKLVPIKREIDANDIVPAGVLKSLLLVSDHCFLLESVEKDKTLGRYSFLGYDPTL